MAEHATHHIHLTLDQQYRFAATFPATPSVPAIGLDEPPPLGEGQGPNAAALLGAAVGNCLGASLVFCLRKARVDVAGLAVDVAVSIDRNDRGRMRISGIDVALSPSVAEGHRGGLDRCEGLFEDFCTVTASVRQGIPISVRVDRDQSGGGTASTGTSV